MVTRVVIAEDQAITRLDLRETLEEQGYEVVGEAGRGDEALDLIRLLAPDVAVLDVKMPGLDGITVAGHITKEKICPVLILTAFAQREFVERANDAGAMAYLIKPFEKGELLPAIELAVGRFRDMQAMASDMASLEEQLETRKVVDRAKAKLIAGGLSEAEAFNFIQRSAMSGRTRMRDVAEHVLDGSLTP